ncbi:hypothetical protein D3C72_2197600 [compost metagenome]
MADAEHLHDMVFLRGLRFVCGEPAAVMQILRHAEMREKPRLLKDITETAFMGRHEQSLFAIGQHLPIQQNLSLIRPQQACYDTDHRGLAGTGAPEQRGDAAFGDE